MVAQRRNGDGIEQLKMIAVESSRIKFRLAGGTQPLILLPVAVNGQGPFQFTIDYNNCELRLDDPKRVEFFGRSAAAEIPLRLANPAKPLILVDAYLNGQGPFQFAIDTGTSTTAITPELGKKLGIASSPV